MPVSPDWNCQVDLDAVVELGIDFFWDEFEELWGLGAAEPPEDVPFEEWVELLGLRDVAAKVVSAALAFERSPDIGRRDLNLPSLLEYRTEEERASMEELISELPRSST